MIIDKLFAQLASGAAHTAGRPTTFIVCLLMVVVWAATGPLFKFSETWQLVINTGTTIITFLMVFLIQSTQNRDAAAMHAKMDELIYAVRKADARFIGIEHLTDTQIEEVRAALEKEAGSRGGKGVTTGESVDKLLERF